MYKVSINQSSNPKPVYKSRTTPIRDNKYYLRIFLERLRKIMEDLVHDSKFERNMDRVISVGITIGYGMDNLGSFPAWSRKFYLFHSVQTGSGPHPASYLMGIGGSLLRKGREFDPSPAYSAKVKNGGAIPPFPHSLIFMVCCLIN
jgi:hypothetical protein